MKCRRCHQHEPEDPFSLSGYSGPARLTLCEPCLDITRRLMDEQARPIVLQIMTAMLAEALP